MASADVLNDSGNGETWADRAAPTPTISTWSALSIAPHPQAAEIVRQVDFYFSEDNLRSDAHLLALIKEGNGTVSLSEILGFKKMRKFKPKSAVREAVKTSTVVEVVENGKRLKRRHPLKATLTVTPKLSEDRNKYVVPEDKPWLTKGMMKPTGFEEDATPETANPEEDSKDYDPDNSFVDRIETAIRKYAARRKMHQDTRLIFEKYMQYGGMDCGAQFVGGVDSRAKEEMTKKEISELTAKYTVSERVLDGLFDDDEGAKACYLVDFEASVKGFLSCELPAICNWYDEEQVRKATRVLRNFFNYLLLHGVCPEYNTQIRAAQKVCDLADEEFPKLMKVDRDVLGGFNKACSTLFDGECVNANATFGDWIVQGDETGWTEEEAKKVFLAGLFAHGDEDQMEKVEAVVQGEETLNKAIKVAFDEGVIGLEVTGIEFVNETAKSIYEHQNLNNTYIKPMGKLHCKRWAKPDAKPEDLPEWVMKKRQEDDIFEFFLDEDILQNCFVGMKMEAFVKDLDIGIKFIDYFETTYVSFYTFLYNERIRDYKKPGPPVAWMEKANAKMGGYALAEKVDGDGEAQDLGEAEEQQEDEVPD